MKVTRLKGHALDAEGRTRYASAACNTRHRACVEFATNPQGGDYHSFGRLTVFLSGGMSDGHAWCSCGVVSPHLPTQAARKRWHADHKAEIQAATSARKAEK